MAISIKSSNEIRKMRVSGKLVAKTHETLKPYIKAGITTAELDKIAYEFILSQDAIPSFKGYNGFPASICTSINEEVIHGIPGIRKLKDGDIIGIDIGVLKDGFHGDSARTYPVGKISDENKKLIEVTEQSFYKSLQFAKENYHLVEISATVQDIAESNGFSVVREFCGHGIGKKLHEDPQIPHYRTLSRGPKMRKGMTICVEPMVNAGKKEIYLLDDEWTVITRDRKYSAHYENTILITDGEPELLTVI